MRVDEIQILLDQGRIALNQGRFDEAAELVDRVLTEEPNHEQALNLRGLLYFKQERFDDAVQLFQGLVAKYPDEPTLLMNLGLAYLKAERYQEAIIELEKALAHQPKNQKILNYLGLAHSGLGHFAEARKYFAEGGSQKMAEQMLQMMSAHDSGSESEQAGEAADEPEIEISVEEGGVEIIAETAPQSVEAEPAEAEDTVDRAFGATFSPPGSGTTADTGDTGAMPSGDTKHPAADDIDMPRKAETSGQHTAVNVESPAVVASVEAAPDSESGATSEPASMPTDLLSTAMSLLQDRYESVIETAAAGRSLQELSRLLALERDSQAPIDHVRPDLIRLRVTSEATSLSRMRDVVAILGDVRAEPRQKRYKGKDIKAIFGGEKHPVYSLVGAGDIFLQARDDTAFSVIAIDDELVYLVEDAFYAAVGQWRWENGRLPGKDGDDLHLVQLRGEGMLAIELPQKRRLGAIRVDNSKLTLPARHLAGWYGNVVPVLVELAFPQQRQGAAVQFQGSGTVLVQFQRD